MRTLRTVTKFLSFALILGILFSLASCVAIGGSLKLKSFTVDRSSIKTVYYVGEEIDFSGIKATVKYSDETLNVEYTAEDLEVSYAEDITATTGTKEVTVSFNDPHLDKVQSVKVQITVKEDPNAVKHASYAVDASGMKTTYFVGDTVDFTGIKVIEKFTNGGADVEMTDLSLIKYSNAENITATAGTKNISVTYNGESAGTVTITVNKPAITTVVLDTEGLTLDYTVGDTVSFDGIKAYLTYENGQEGTVTDIDFVTDLATLTDTYGTKQVTVKINDSVSGTTRNATFEVKVDGIVDYELDTSEMTLSYLEGETVSFAGIKVTAKYYYESQKPVDFEELEFVYDANITAAPGNKSVTVKVGDEVVGSFNITVGDIPSATANTEGVDLSYRVGESVSLAGLTVTLKFTDGTPDETKELSDLTVVTDLAALTATPGTKDITVKYVFDEYDILATFKITVWGISSYTVDTSEMKTEYIAGDAIVYDGIKIYANYLDGGESVLVDMSTVSFSDSGATATAGDKTIPVMIGGKDANVSVNIKVTKNSIVSTVISDYNDTYVVGDSVDLSGLFVTVTYLNGSSVKITNLTVDGKDTSTAGTKTLVATFYDEINGENTSVSFTIVVIEAKTNISQFEKDEYIIAFDSDNKAAGSHKYGETGFSGEFLSGGKTYVIGDDNAFEMVPDFTVENKDGLYETLTAFYSVVEIYVWVDGEYKTLSKTAKSPTNYTYSLGDEVLVTVDTYYGIYQFARPIDKVKISVMPSDEYYNGTENFNPVVLEATVIDAYNVYEAWQLAVIDTDTSRTDWDAFKNEHGIKDINPVGVVLHKDITVLHTDVPSSFFDHSTRDVTYYNKTTNDTKVYPAGTPYFKDGTTLYSRQGGGEFIIEGNFFTVNVKDFPVVPSNGVFDSSLDLGYGADFSNAVLIQFEVSDDNWQPKPEDIPYVTFNNISFIGNASQDFWQEQSDDGLLTAGGLILVKSSRHADVTLNNVISNSFFITYFPDYEGNMTVNGCKCYDSYQNAAFVWSGSKLVVNDSFISGAGGPIVIAMSVKNDDNVQFNPTVILNNTVAEGHVTGDEIWFTAVQATSIVASIKALGAGLEYAGLGNFTNSEGKMNLEAVLMPEANDASAASVEIGIQGTISSNGFGINRWYEGDKADAFWSVIYNHPAFIGGAPIMTVADASGNLHSIYFNGDTFCDLYGNALGTDASHAALFAAFAQADQILLSQGGLSVVFEFYHK